MTITFKRFLSEAGERIPATLISDAEASAWVNDHAPAYIKKPGFIWRGMNGSDGMKSDFSLFDTTRLNRKAAYTSNLVNLWVSESPSWANFPKRSKSYICTTTYWTAKNYQSLYLIIPASNAEVGICPTADMWASFGKRLTDVDDVDDFNSLIGRLGLISREAMQSFPLLEKELKAATLDRLEIAITEKKIGGWLLNKMKQLRYGSLYEMFTWLFDPTANGFTATSAAQLKKGEDTEVWVQGDVLQVYFDDDVEKSFDHYKNLSPELKAYLKKATDLVFN